MQRQIMASAVGGRWTGMALDVTGPALPGLRVEVADGRRLVLRQAGVPVLLGRQRAGCLGVYYARTGRYRSPLPPLRADDARRIRAVSADNEAWAGRWGNRFADVLHSAPDGPLHTGRWNLSRGMSSASVEAYWSKLADVDPDRGHITWFGYGDPEHDKRDVLPLRRLSAPGAGRVRAYRRQFREGIMPPVLLLWISGLNTLVVIDGHDRIAAALAEGSRPEVLVLAPAGDPVGLEAAQRMMLREYTGRAEHLQRQIDGGDVLAARRMAIESREVAVYLGEIERSAGLTRSWPLVGGVEAWDGVRASMAPGWDPGDGETLTID